MSFTPIPDRLLARGAAFSVVGAINTAVGIAVIVVAGLAGVGPVLANVLGYAAGLVLSFTLNARVTFRRRAVDRGTVARFFGAFGVAFAANLGVVAAVTHFVGARSIVGSLAGVPLYTVVFYLLCEYWVFERATEASARPDRLGKTPP